MFKKNLLLRKLYMQFLEDTRKNNGIISTVISKEQIQAMHWRDYGLTKFEVYMYIKVCEYLNNLEVDLERSIFTIRDIFTSESI